jgi:hypothetical protein
MTGYQPRDPGDDAELDRVLGIAMSGILAKLEAGFHPGAGLADIYTRSARGGHSMAPAVPEGDSSGSSRLAEACDQIDLLTAWLADISLSAEQDTLGGSGFLELARVSLVELRAGLASRTMAKPEARRLTSDIENQLSHADQILRSQHATTLDHLASETRSRDGALTDQARITREMVIRLYEPDGHDRCLTPAR